MYYGIKNTDSQKHAMQHQPVRLLNYLFVVLPEAYFKPGEADRVRHVGCLPPPPSKSLPATPVPRRSPKQAGDYIIVVKGQTTDDIPAALKHDHSQTLQRLGQCVREDQKGLQAVLAYTQSLIDMVENKNHTPAPPELLNETGQAIRAIELTAANTLYYPCIPA